MSLIEKVKCKAGFHDTFTIAADLEYNFASLDLNLMCNDELISVFFYVCAIRCRRCDYIYTSFRK